MITFKYPVYWLRQGLWLKKVCEILVPRRWYFLKSPLNPKICQLISQITFKLLSSLVKIDSVGWVKLNGVRLRTNGPMGLKDTEEDKFQQNGLGLNLEISLRSRLFFFSGPWATFASACISAADITYACNYYLCLHQQHKPTPPPDLDLIIWTNSSSSSIVCITGPSSFHCLFNFLVGMGWS